MRRRRPAVMAAILLAWTASLSPVRAQTAEDDPAGVFLRYVAIVNAGDLEGLRKLLSEDIARPGYPCPARVSNRDCVVEWVGGSVIQQHGWITPTTSLAIDGDAAYAGIEIRTELVRRSGVERLVGIDKVRVRDGKIIELRFLHNPLDEQTSRYYAWRLPQVDRNPANH